MPPRILLADDDAGFAESLSELLTHYGYRVEAVHTASEALAQVRTIRYDAAVVDLSLTGGHTEEGLEIIAALKQAQSTARAILISARGDGGTHAKSQAAGADQYLEKPISGAGLHQVLQDLGVGETDGHTA